MKAVLMYGFECVDHDAIEVAFQGDIESYYPGICTESVGKHVFVCYSDYIFVVTKDLDDGDVHKIDHLYSSDEMIDMDEYQSLDAARNKLGCIVNSVGWILALEE